MPSASQPLSLRAQNVTKAFSGVPALRDGRLNLRHGTVHALCGGNGAGKSTFLAIVMGLLERDSGSIQIERREVQFTTPHQAIDAGIAIVTQELSPVPGMTVAENIFLGREPRYLGCIVDYCTLNRQAAALLEKLGFEINATRRMATLSLAETQLVEIAKALSRDSRIVIMDEPTSAIGHHETELLFSAIRSLTRIGKSIIYVTHRLTEIFELADDYTVFRDGLFVEEGLVKDIDRRHLIRQIIGRDLNNQFRTRPNGATRSARPPFPSIHAHSRVPETLSEQLPPAATALITTPPTTTAPPSPAATLAVAPPAFARPRAPVSPFAFSTSATPPAPATPHRAATPATPPALEVRSYSCPGRFGEIDLVLNPGEIVGLYGLLGSGRSEFLQALFGLEKNVRGELRAAGRTRNIRDPQDAKRLRIALVTEDRKATGLVLPLSVSDNLSLSSLPSLSTGGFVRRRDELLGARALVERFRIKATSLRMPVRSMSGGNQQKVVLGRWFQTAPQILLLDEPTRGIDEGAKHEIYQFMTEFTQNGGAIIMASSEVDEILGMTGRVYVFRRGLRAVPYENTCDETAREDLMHLASP